MSDGSPRVRRVVAALAATLVVLVPSGVTAAEEGPDTPASQPPTPVVAPSPGQAIASSGPVEDVESGAGGDPVEDLIARAVDATRELHYEGDVTVASFGEDGPRLAALEVTRGPGGLNVSQEGSQLGRAEGEGFLQSSSRLLRVGGVERIPTQLDRLRTKYEVGVDGPIVLDTGPATSLALLDRQLGVVREILYCDDETGLIVRRETFDEEGTPVRVVAFTDLDPGELEVALPSSDGRDVEERHGEPGDAERLREAGFVIPESLPRTYELIAAVEVPDASVPTAHLVYGDGLYTLSVFQQQGRLDRRVVEGATELGSGDAGARWRWPGSEPRRVVWTGDGITFTALSDAPTDELASTLATLPAEPAPGTLDRLWRGLTRLGGVLLPG